MATNNATNNAGFQVLRVYNVAGSPHTWTKPTSFTAASFIEVWVVGGGGGGGGTAATGVSQAAASAAGGGGGFGYKKINSGSLGANETVTVGAAGSGASAGNNTGSSGGTSSFGAHVSCTGGSGGTGSPATNANAINDSGDGGVGTGGDINVTGQKGDLGYVAQLVPFRAQGGTTPIGLPGPPRAVTTPVEGFGGGGPGTISGASTASQAGRAAQPGIVIVKEYY